MLVWEKDVKNKTYTLFAGNMEIAEISQGLGGVWSPGIMFSNTIVKPSDSLEALASEIEEIYERYLDECGLEFKAHAQRARKRAFWMNEFKGEKNA